MAKAFQCDRCKKYYDGDPYGEIRFEDSDQPVYARQFCESCFKHIKKEAYTYVSIR